MDIYKKIANTIKIGNLKIVKIKKKILEYNKIKHEFENIPKINLYDVNEISIFIVDQDVPSYKCDNPTSYIHFIYRFKKEEKTNINTNKINLFYVPPHPPKGSGPHKYYIYVYDKYINNQNDDIKAIYKTHFTINNGTEDEKKIKELCDKYSKDKT